MADTFKGIVTADGKKRQLPYGNLLGITISDTSLTVEGGFADAAVVGKKNKKTDEAIASLKEDNVYQGEELKQQINYNNNLCDGRYSNLVYNAQNGIRYDILDLKYVSTDNPIYCKKGDVISFYNKASNGFLLFYNSSGYISYQAFSKEDSKFKIEVDATYIHFEFVFTEDTKASTVKRAVIYINEEITSRELLKNNSKQVDNLNLKVDKITGEIYYTSPNLYNSALQTDDTISPHYFVGGVPYHDTTFDTSYNCTAPIAIDSDTEYTLAIVPDKKGVSIPWGNAENGVFFYDGSGAYISSTKKQNFKTPINAATLRFNYAIQSGITLSVLNANCMLVKGNKIPTEYEKYLNDSIKERVEELAKQNINNSKKIKYHITKDTGVVLATHYCVGKDIVYNICKRGVNNIVEFKNIGLVENSSKKVTDLIAPTTKLLSAEGDWHSPYIAKALQNINGDDITSTNFTGGNHAYNNTGTGVPTGRTAWVNFYADGYQLTEGSGECDTFCIRWCNMIQGYNTRKADGTGREILSEIIEMNFDGEKFISTTKIVPLENIAIELWYGLQINGLASYPQINFIGDSNLETEDYKNSPKGKSKNTNAIICRSANNDLMIMGIDTSIDLGRREHYNGTSGIFTKSYGKAYCNIINNTDASIRLDNVPANANLVLVGEYRFMREN